MVRKAASDFLPDIPPGPVSADEIVTEMLDAVITGRLRAGTSVHDESIARHLQISRTPVREAFLRLRALGVIETAASRYTRITLVPPARTAAAFDVWAWLLRMLCRETIPTASDRLISDLQAQADAFSAALAEGRYDDMAAANFAFFALPLNHSGNPILVEQIRSVVYLLRLGDSQLPEHVDLDLVLRSHEVFLRAFRTRDARLGDQACALISGLEIPGAESQHRENVDRQIARAFLTPPSGPTDPLVADFPDALPDDRDLRLPSS